MLTTRYVLISEQHNKLNIAHHNILNLTQHDILKPTQHDILIIQQ